MPSRWDQPRTVLAEINSKYKPDWNLNEIETISRGQSGARVFLCQDSHSRNLFVVKSFQNSNDANLEFANTKRAARRFNLTPNILTDLIVLHSGAAFAMKLGGNIDAQPVSEMFTLAIQGKGIEAERCSVVIDLIGQKLQRFVRSSVRKIAFSSTELDQKLRDQLHSLDSASATMLLEWWDEKTRESNKQRIISFDYAHGDLHADNIIANSDASQLDDLHLIDFGSYGLYPMFKDFARLERDIRFRLFRPDTTNGKNIEEHYLSEQEGLSDHLHGEGPQPERLAGLTRLIRKVRKEAAKSIGDNRQFEHDYACFLEYMFFAASTLEDRTVVQRKAALSASLYLTQVIDDHLKSHDLREDKKVLWQLAYSFLRLDQLPSGGWSRSLPQWWLARHGDNAETQAKAYTLRRLGGLNLTCIALLNYGRTLCSIQQIVPETALASSGPDIGSQDQADDPLANFSSLLREIERENGVCAKTAKFIIGRQNSRGSIPASLTDRDADTEIHHTLTGIVLLITCNFFSGSLLVGREYFQALSRMCDYIIAHGLELTKNPDRSFQIYCILVFLEHILTLDKFLKIYPPVATKLEELSTHLPIIRSKLIEDSEFGVLPNEEKGLSDLLMNLPLLFQLSGCSLIPDHGDGVQEYVSELLDRVHHSQGTVIEVEGHSGAIPDFGHTTEFWWAMDRWSVRTQAAIDDAVLTLMTRLPEIKFHSLTTGVSFSHLLGMISTSPELEEFLLLEKQIQKTIDSGATDRDVLKLLFSIFGRSYSDLPEFKGNIHDDESLLLDFDQKHEIIPMINSVKAIFTETMKPGFYWNDLTNENQTRMEYVREARRETPQYFETDLAEKRNLERDLFLSNANWFHFFNYLSRIRLTDNPIVLDVGCGSGAYSLREFLPRGYHVHFVDASERVLQRLSDTLIAAKVEPDQYQIEHKAIDELVQERRDAGRYEVIFAKGVLVHVEADAIPRIFSWFHEVMADEGFLFVDFRIDDHTLVARDGRFFEYHETTGPITNLLTNAGFKIEDLTMTTEDASIHGERGLVKWANFHCSKGA